MTRVEAFLTALPHAHDDEFVNAPGLGTFRARFIRLGMERGVVVVHSTGAGFAIRQPTSHGVCQECVRAKGSRTICEHCTCPMCVWFRIADERASPPVSREKWQQLVRRLKSFTFGQESLPAPALDSDI